MNSLSKIAIVSFLILNGSQFVHANTFKISFEWGNIPLCTSGNPNTVDNPNFKISGAPKGTTSIQFSLVDEDVPQFNHGGGSVAYKNEKVIKSGAFQYESPCPPSGSHTYTWTAIAVDADGNELASTKASKEYP